MANTLSILVRALLLVVLVAGIDQTRAQTFDPAAKAAAISPYVDEQTLAVGHVDLDRIDSAALVITISQIGPQNDPEFAKHLARVETTLKTVLAAMRGAGLSELYVVMSLADVPQGPPFLVAPLKAGADAQMAAGVLREVTRLPAAEPIGKVVVAGSQATIERLKTLKPTARPEFARALQAAGDATAHFIYSPTDDTRRVLKEMLPRLPDEIGGGSGRALADGFTWATIGVDAPPKLALKLRIQAKDADSAAALRGLLISGLTLLTKEEHLRRQWPEIGQLPGLITPQIKGDQLLLDITEQNGGAQQVLTLLARPVQAMRVSAGRSQSVNNLKQIGLVMHNYHDTHKRFPPQAIRDKEGKPLLSWRVAVLPFVGAEPLYKEFHLDEPWDSEHNKKLIGKMPAAFASPALGDERRQNGLTSYVVPLSRATGAAPAAAASDRAAPAASETVFDDPAGRSFSKITDGTSNTIMILEVHPSAAVTWTRPDDFVIEEKDPLRQLRGQPNDGFHAALCDGSVRFIKNTIDATMFLRLLQMNDGNPVGDF